ncbi:hypothetical protein AHiyo8_34140 [Arthrobacter sp. Hiyo8]|nr:hypothetical protein AHiyo8_34140 [Arthrobacter sp. Hiyo8]
MSFHIDATVRARNLDVSLSVGQAETVAILGPTGPESRRFCPSRRDSCGRMPALPA